METTIEKAKDTLTTAQASVRLGVTIATVNNYCNAGKLSAIRTPGGHWRIPASEVDRYLAPLKEALAKREAGRVAALTPATPPEHPLFPGCGMPLLFPDMPADHFANDPWDYDMASLKDMGLHGWVKWRRAHPRVDEDRQED